MGQREEVMMNIKHSLRVGLAGDILSGRKECSTHVYIGALPVSAQVYT